MNVTATTTGVSLFSIERISRSPIPGTRKICSVITAPAKTLGTYTVSLSGGNYLKKYNAWAANDGSYCVSIYHGLASGYSAANKDPIWNVTIPTGGGSQTLASGDCP